MKNLHISQLGAYLFIVPALLVGLTSSVLAQESPDFDDDEQARADAHYEMAVRLYGQGRYREAVEEFDRVLEIHDDPVVHCNRAVPLVELGRLEEAKVSLVACREGYEDDSNDYREVSAEIDGLTTTVEIVEPTARDLVDRIDDERQRDGMAQVDHSAPEPVQVDEPPSSSEPSREETQGGWSAVQIAGLSLLGTGVGLGAAAAVVDWQSGELVDQYVAESDGGPGTSETRHRRLAEQVEGRQQIFRGLTVAAAAAGVLGIGFSTWGLLQRPDEPGLSLRMDGEGFGFSWRARF